MTAAVIYCRDPRSEAARTNGRSPFPARSPRRSERSTSTSAMTIAGAPPAPAAIAPARRFRERPPSAGRCFPY